MSQAVELTKSLIACRSLTPLDAGCQELMSERLRAAGFGVESLPFGEVRNLWARRGRGGPVFCFAGHTDVVPSGPPGEWASDPFTPEVRDGVLYGRGAADMKSGLAAMVTAAEEFVGTHPKHRGSIAFLITSDEEGPSVDGTRRVVEALAARGERISWCVVGEPSSERSIGDTLKIGRRGSLSGRLTVHGVQGHVAYPQRAENPIHTLAPALAELTSRVWDGGTEHFQPTSFQVSNLNAGTGAPNVTPGELKARFNLRDSTAQPLDELKATVGEVLRRHGVRYPAWMSGSGEAVPHAPGGPKKRPSEVPPAVDSRGRAPATVATASLTASESSPGAV